VGEMQEQSVWLGRYKELVRKLMICSFSLTLLLFFILVVNKVFFGGQVGVHEMLRPEGGILAKTLLSLLALSLLIGGIYFSDRKGAIEPEKSGFFDIFSLVTSRIAFASILFIEIVMLYEVIARYVFTRPTLWANEMTMWIAAFLFLLSGLYAMQQRSHIRIFIVYEMFPRWAKKLSDSISVLLISTFTFCLVWGSFDEALDKFQRFESFGTAWDPPIPATVKPAILIAVVLVAVQAISNLIADWNKEEKKYSPADEIDEVEIENIRKTLKERS
jgi:TRAP-type C4-dicarboxylate transport system permease small subunit